MNPKIKSEVVLVVGIVLKIDLPCDIPSENFLNVTRGECDLDVEANNFERSPEEGSPEVNY